VSTSATSAPASVSAGPSGRAAGDRADDRLDAFAEAWERFFRSARRGRRRITTRDTLTMPQYLLIEPLAARMPRSVGELAEHAGVSGPTATRMLDALCRAGWVQRRQSERDRRCVEVVLTDSGRGKLRARHREVREYRRRVLEALEPADRQAAERLLHRLADAIDAV
jgi:DNA-binding MarR family transcriptional regulator